MSATLRYEVNDWFLGQNQIPVSGVDHFYWCPTLLWSGTPVSRTETARLPELATSSARAATVRVRMLARTSGDHRSTVAVGGTVVSDVESAGLHVQTHDASGVDVALLSDPLDVTVELPGPPGRPRGVGSSYSRTRITTRRFWERPSRVLLSATGSSSP